MDEERYTMQTLIKKSRSNNTEFQIDFRIRKVIRDKEGHFIMIKGSFFQGDITIINMSAPNECLT